MAVAAHVNRCPKPGLHRRQLASRRRIQGFARNLDRSRCRLYPWSAVPVALQRAGAFHGSVHGRHLSDLGHGAAVVRRAFRVFHAATLAPGATSLEALPPAAVAVHLLGTVLADRVRASRLRCLPARLVRGRRRPRQALCLRMRRSSTLRNRIPGGCRPGDLRDVGAVGYAGCGRNRYPPQNTRRQEILARGLVDCGRLSGARDRN